MRLSPDKATLLVDSKHASSRLDENVPATPMYFFRSISELLRMFYTCACLWGKNEHVNITRDCIMVKHVSSLPSQALYKWLHALQLQC